MNDLQDAVGNYLHGLVPGLVFLAIWMLVCLVGAVIGAYGLTVRQSQPQRVHAGGPYAAPSVSTNPIGPGFYFKWVATLWVIPAVGVPVALHLLRLGVSLLSGGATHDAG